MLDHAEGSTRREGEREKEKNTIKARWKRHETRKKRTGTIDTHSDIARRKEKGTAINAPA